MNRIIFKSTTEENIIDPNGQSMGYYLFELINISFRDNINMTIEITNISVDDKPIGNSEREYVDFSYNDNIEYSGNFDDILFSMKSNILLSFLTETKFYGFENFIQIIK